MFSSVDWAVVIATLVGPIAAVGVTLWYQKRDREYQRRHMVFASMMRSRAYIGSIEFVGALNLVLVEFCNHPEVMKKHANLMAVFTDTGWEGSVAAREALVHKARSSVADLLSSMSKVIGLNISQLDILNAVYAPRGLIDDEEAQRHLRSALTSVLTGKEPLQVALNPSILK